MRITYIDPLSRAWGRMKKALFQPFNITKWFVVGFTAFLAGLMDSHGGGKFNKSFQGDHTDFRDVIEFPRTAWGWFMDHTAWAVLILIGIMFIIGLIAVFTWLSSRGKFMFLDNVVHDQAQVVKPWYEFKSQGNSLFLWRLCFGLICFFIMIIFVIQCMSITYNIYESHFPHYVPIMTIVGMVLLTVLLFFLIGFISMLLDSFIVPIMYKHGISTIQAWNRFLPLLSKYLLHFILFGILMFLLFILIVFCFIAFGIFTCCLGFILLVLPYISSVVTLPVSYTLRVFSIEFLAQFGPKFSVFPLKKGKSTGRSLKK